MADLDSLLAELELDDEQIAMLKSALSTRDQEADKKLKQQEARLRIATDEELAKKSPRAIKALREGATEIPEDVEELEAWLTDYEQQLTKLGVPDPTVKSTSSQETGWGAPMTGGGNPGPPANVDALREAMEGGDTENIVRVLHEMQRNKQGREIREVAAAYQDQRPIISRS